MSRTAADLLPALGLRLVAGPVELRGITDDDLPALGALVEAGVHEPGRMPFYVPWTEAPAEDLARNTAQFHWRCRAEFSPASWTLGLGVWFEGELVGTQGFSTRDYLVTRSGETGSWLGRAHQGRGIGTRMRRAVCALVLDHLDGEEVTSGAFTDNPASLAVSRKVGYRDNGLQRVQRREGELATVQLLTLRREDFDRGDEPVSVEGLAAFRRSIGLPDAPAG
jgi:RimJ/RimL family protein N-acetyltransferase